MANWNDDYPELLEELDGIKREVALDLVHSVKSGKRFQPKLIPAPQYNRALNEFVKYGSLIRFPRKKIVQWKFLVADSISLLSYITELFGHTDSFDPYDFHDMWMDEDEPVLTDWNDAFELLISRYDPNEVLFPQFTNGHDLISDYGLRPLEELLVELFQKDTEEEMLVVINKMLDVTHPRSDLAEIFIEGGSKSLTAISQGVFI